MPPEPPIWMLQLPVRLEFSPLPHIVFMPGNFASCLHTASLLVSKFNVSSTLPEAVVAVLGKVTVTQVVLPFTLSLPSLSKALVSLVKSVILAAVEALPLLK